MSLFEKEIALKPIGIVRNNSSEIILEQEFTDALDGIEEYSHIIVMFWFDKLSDKDRSIRKIIPYGLTKVGEKGVLATHMPQRPNPIGLSIVRLLKRSGNILKVQNLDAFDGTPILDIKPYNGHRRDLISDLIIPKWEEDKQRLP